MRSRSTFHSEERERRGAEERREPSLLALDHQLELVHLISICHAPWSVSSRTSTCGSSSRNTSVVLPSSVCSFGSPHLCSNSSNSVSRASGWPRHGTANVISWTLLPATPSVRRVPNRSLSVGGSVRISSLPCCVISSL